MGWEPMACEPDMALLMTASDSLDHKKAIANISSKSMASPMMPSACGTRQQIPREWPSKAATFLFLLVLSSWVI